MIIILYILSCYYIQLYYCVFLVHNNKFIDNCNSDIYTTVHLHTYMYMNLLMNLSGELLHF